MTCVDDPAPPDLTAPALAVSAPRSIKRQRLVTRGVTVRAESNEPSALVFELVGSARGVRLARVGDIVLGERKASLGTGRRTARLKISRRFRRLVRRRAALRIRVTATDAAGNRTTGVRRLRVR